MSKFDTCIYAEYFGDYGMNICNHPSKANDKSIYEGDCKKCKLRMTSKDSIDRCPFCGKTAHLDQYCGEYHITCHRCKVEMCDSNVDKLIERWNKRA